MPLTCHHATMFRQNTILDGIYSLLFETVVVQCNDCGTAWLIPTSVLLTAPFPLGFLREIERERVLNHLGRRGHEGQAMDQARTTDTRT